MEDLIITKLEKIVEDLGEVKKDMVEMKKDMVEMKIDMVEMKKDLGWVKKDLGWVKKKDPKVMFNDVLKYAYYFAFVGMKEDIGTQEFGQGNCSAFQMDDWIDDDGSKHTNSQGFLGSVGHVFVSSKEKELLIKDFSSKEKKLRIFQLCL